MHHPSTIKAMHAQLDAAPPASSDTASAAPDAGRTPASELAGRESKRDTLANLPALIAKATHERRRIEVRFTNGFGEKEVLVGRANAGFSCNYLWLASAPGDVRASVPLYSSIRVASISELSFLPEPEGTG